MKEFNKITQSKDYLKRFKFIIFDLDDTLYLEQDYVISGFNAVSKYCNDESLSNQLWDCFLNKQPTFDTVFQDRVKKQECLKIYREHKPSILLIDGVNKMLLELLENGSRLGMITDGRPNGQWNKIESLGIKDLFEKIIVTDELGGIEFRKPNEIAFKLMKDFFGCDYGEMVYVGDNINKDFIAPNKLGMNSVYIKNRNGLYWGK